MKISVIFLLAMLVASHVVAAEIPEYDIKAFCLRIADMADGSKVLERQCRKDEEGAKKRIGKMDVDEKTMQYCGKIARAGGSSYALLEQCIKDEQEAAADLD